MVAPTVVLTLTTDNKGRILLGKRNDNKRWTLPGGHIGQNETPLEAIKREVQEETNIAIEDFVPIKINGNEHIQCYSAFYNGNQEPSGKNDPDQEVGKWMWVDVRQGVPKNIYNNLHGPEDKTNIIRQLFDLSNLSKSESTWLDAGFMDLSK
jgi:8-oxo-dGTP pyrophosphatase MutT (NUDIX family)